MQYSLTVGHLCSRLLVGLSADQLDNWELRGDRLDPKDARAWFARAQKIGEEKWLLEHVVRREKPEPRANDGGQSEVHLFRVIGAKYPKYIPELYRAVLKKPWSSYGDYIDEILASKLTREQKIALFEEGAKHEDTNHRFAAIEGLAGVDKPLFNKHLLKELKEVSVKPKKSKVGVPGTEQLARLVKRSDDPECWNALTAAAKAADYDTRTDMLFVFSPDRVPDDVDPIRRQRIEFFARFLDDRTNGPSNDQDHPHEEVRDYAASRLAALFRFPVERYCESHFCSVPHNHDLGPLSRLLMRDAVRELAKRELTRPAK
jgi:hypothetical protein